MPAWLGIILALFALGFLIFIHELGHFLAARYHGVKVEMFAVGFGPNLWSMKRGDTVYALKAFPLGGFVKLYGEDATDPKILANKKSFASKTPWQRTQILVAGVVMNMLVALILLTFGFMLGMDPLIASQEDLEAKIEQGVVQHLPGVYVKSENDEQLQKLARLVTVNDQAVTGVDDLGAILTKPLEQTTKLEFVNPDQTKVTMTYGPGATIQNQDLQFYPLAQIPQLKVLANPALDLQLDDVIVSANAQALLGDVNKLTRGTVDQVVLDRDQQLRRIDLSDNNIAAPVVLIREVVEDSAAADVDLPENVYLWKINGQELQSMEQTIDLLVGSENLELELQELDLVDERMIVQVQKEAGDFLGVYLQPVVATNQIADITFTVEPTLGSLIILEQAQVPWYKAPFAAVDEAWRLSELTVIGFVDVVKDLAFRAEINDNVGGIVAVTQVTGELFRYDFFAALILVALISLSLAVINILPFPALDGGRLLFVFIEVLRGGKPVSAKYEALVHMIGFFLLLLLILVITYNDILRIWN